MKILCEKRNCFLAHLMYCVKVGYKEVGVIVTHLSLYHTCNSLQSHPRIHMLFGKNFQLTTRLSGGEGEGETKI